MRGRAWTDEVKEHKSHLRGGRGVTGRIDVEETPTFIRNFRREVVIKGVSVN